MALITDYASLQAVIAQRLGRTDMTDDIKNFIQEAEARMKRDRRLRKLNDAGAFNISTDNLSLPSDFHSVESWYHDGATFFGSIETVAPGQLGGLKGKCGATGTPRYVAFVDGNALFAPAPNATFETRLIYWRKIVSLSDTQTTNWLLTDHPDIYLNAALIRSAMFLRDDDRKSQWEEDYTIGAEELSLATDQGQFSGPMTRQFDSIG